MMREQAGSAPEDKAGHPSGQTGAPPNKQTK